MDGERERECGREGTGKNEGRREREEGQNWSRGVLVGFTCQNLTHFNHFTPHPRAHNKSYPIMQGQRGYLAQ